MPIVVSGTSPIRALGHLERLDLLNLLFDEVWVPPAVARELRHPRGNHPPIEIDVIDGVLLREPLDQGVVQELQRGLQPGESEAIALALEMHIEEVLMDDAEGRVVATAMGVTPVGTAAVLLRAKERGHISLVRPSLDRLQNELRFFISASLREHVLRMAGEGPPV